MAIGSQQTFTGGEVSPSLYARVDLARYYTSLRRCENWIVQRHGGVVTRPGFRYCGTAASPSVTSRLFEFQFSATSSVLVELGPATVRFWQNGAAVPTWTISSPYAAGDLRRIVGAQVGAVLMLCHPNHAPRELTWDGASFTLTVSSFGPSPDLGVPAAPTLSVPSSAGTTKVHTYVISLTLPSGEDTRASAPASITCDLRSDNPVTVTSTGAFNVYRGRNGVFGYIGSSSGTTFLDDNIVPDYSNPPPQWPNPFSATGTYPSAVTHYQQRRWFGGSINDPQTVRASRASELRRFDVAEPARDDDAIEATLAATQGQPVQHLVPLSRLIVMTSRGEWAADGGNDVVLTPNNTGFQALSSYGASSVPPVMTGEGCVYVQAQGTRVRDLVYNPQLQQYGGTDLSVLASHLFERYTITDMAFQSYPFSVVWCVRNDGVLLALTYLRDQEVWGWSRHVTDGAVESIATVREGEQDALYAIVRRTVLGSTVRYLERLADRFPPDPLTHVGVDAALSYDGRNADAGRTVTLTGASWGNGAVVTASFSGGLVAGAGVGDVVQLLQDGVVVWRGLVQAVVSASVLTVVADRVVPVWARGLPVVSYAVAQRTFTGLTHLIGETVSALNDGNVETGLVVSSTGTITLAQPGAVVTVGLPFTCLLETLDLTVPNTPITREKVKQVHEVTLYVQDSRGLETQSGRGEWMAMKERESEPLDASVTPFTGTVRTKVPTDWNYPGRIRVRQADPLASTILAILPEVSVGG